jgi:hypothetical protein
MADDAQCGERRVRRRRRRLRAGFGLPMALSTVLLSFYHGAAVLAILFPVYILVSCDADVNAVHGMYSTRACPGVTDKKQTRGAASL